VGVAVAGYRYERRDRRMVCPTARPLGPDVQGEALAVFSSCCAVGALRCLAPRAAQQLSANSVICGVLRAGSGGLAGVVAGGAGAIRF
jgi:hypothetical protein